MTPHELNTAWSSYDFHYEILCDLQEQNDEIMLEYHNFINNDLNPSKKDILKFKNKINSSYDSLIVGYEKCLHAIEELINANEKCSNIPPERQIDSQYLREYKNLTWTQYEVAKIEQNEINEVLN